MIRNGLPLRCLPLELERRDRATTTQATTRFEEGLPLLREVGEKQWTAIVLSSLGLIALYRGKPRTSQGTV